MPAKNNIGGGCFSRGGGRPAATGRTGKMQPNTRKKAAKKGRDMVQQDK